MTYKIHAASGAVAEVTCPHCGKVGWSKENTTDHDAHMEYPSEDYITTSKCKNKKCKKEFSWKPTDIKVI